jgi:c-di-GMP-binding flagellar brake protein YcgR
MEPVVKNRKQLTPSAGIPKAEGAHAMRRGGARREVTERVLLKTDGATYEAWALNVSRGGVRLILEDPVKLGEEFEVTIGAVESSPLVRRARVVWIQEELDGAIVGLEFIVVPASERSVPSAPES